MSDLQKNLLQYLLLSSSLLSQFTGLPFHPQFSGLAIGLEVPHGSIAKGRGAQMLPGKHQEPKGQFPASADPPS